MEPLSRWEDSQRAWLSNVSISFIQSRIDWKLHHLAGPAHSGVSALAERLRDVEVEAGSKRSADAEAESQKLVNAEGQRPEDQRGPESKSRSPRPAGSGPKLDDK